MLRIVVTNVLVSLVCLPIALGDEPTSPDETPETIVRQTIARSLPYIEREGVRWMEEKKCDSCHQVPFMIWSLNAAAERGFAVDSQKLAEWNSWARDWKSVRGRAKPPEGDEATTLRGSPDEVSQFLLGRYAAERAGTPDAASYWPALYREGLLQGQLPDGSWKPGGQLPGQKRPLRETQEVTTLWALTALQSNSVADDAAQAALSKATAWLGDATVGESTEWWAAKLLWERSRANSVAANRVREELLKRQQDDGGWGWLAKDPSDALGTSQAIYAICRAGLTSEDPALRRAIRYLCQTQAADGTWAVKGTKQAKRDRIEPTATFWGTCWSVIALAETLPRR